MRDCENCTHRESGGCTKWECEFEPVNMTLEFALQIVSDFETFETKHDRLDEALEKVREAAEVLQRLGGFDYQNHVKAMVQNEFIRGFSDGQVNVERLMFKSYYLKLIDKGIDPENCPEITFEGYGKEPITFEPVRKGYWMPCEPDYDREGNQILKRGANCSECERFESHPERYKFCGHCGAWMVKGDE